MYQIIKEIINYTGGNQNNWIDSYIVQTCQIVIPTMIFFFIYCFTKIITYICNFSKK